MTETDKSILIIDDEGSNTNPLADGLADDYIITIAENAEQTFVKLEEAAPPDMILLDVLLPDIDGFELCKILKNNVKTKDIPIIFISAKSDTEDVLMGFSLGGVDYISKPFQVEEVKARVKNHMRLKELQRRLKEKNNALIKENQERMAAEKAGKESEERYKKLSEATIEGVILIDNTKVIALNRAAAKMFGYKPDEAIGKNVFDFVIPEFKDIAKYNLFNNYTRPYEIMVKKKDGTVFPIEVLGGETVMNGKTVRQTALRDLTGEKQAEQVRFRHHKLKGVLETAKTICHEMNQPLQIISGQLELINIKQTEDDPNRKRLLCIKTEIERMSEITRKLMNITRYETRDYIKGESIIDLDKSALPADHH